MAGCRKTDTAKSRDKQRDRKIADGEKCRLRAWRKNKQLLHFPSFHLEFKIELAMKYLYKCSVHFPTQCLCTVDSRQG